MGELMRDFDWAASPMGSPATWPRSLQTALRISLTSRFPMVIWWGSDLRLLYNDAWRPALGALKHPHALGSPGREIWPEIWNVIGPMLEGVLASGVATWEDDQLLVYDRYGHLEETYWTYSYSPIWLDDGAVGGVFTAVTETTERVIGERRLRTLRDLSERISEARAPEAAGGLAAEALSRNPHDFPFALVYIWNADGVLHRAGASGIEAGHPSAPETVRSDDPAPPWPFHRAASGQPVVIQSPGPLPGGPWEEGAREAMIIPLAASGREEPAGFLVAGVSPRLTLDEEYRGFLQLAAGHIATAVSNARAYEEERRRAEALAELDRAKTDFFSNVSHEFRTPLTLLLGPVEDALEDVAAPLLPAHRERLAVAHRNSLRLLKLVNTLLDFSRLEAGRVDASFQPTDLAELTGDLASTFRSAIERAGLSFEVECEPLPEPVYVDRHMWEKIVLNLLSNAFKFTLEGSIGVRLRVARGGAELSVSDTGCGIAATDLPRVFERFHRVRASRSRTQEGTGIGLALVRELARLHGGDVDVESEEGAGSTFRVTVPLGMAHLPPEQIGADRRFASTALGAAPYVEEALRWGAGVPGVADRDGPPVVPLAGTGGLSPGAVGAGAGRVLLADDNADMREYVERLLSGHWQVETVADGQIALERARATRPDLVITDVMMPGLDGFELLAALRGDPETATFPIIMLSARAGEEARVEGLEAGADDYLLKPFGARELLARVGGVLALARVRREAHAAIRDSEERLRLALQAAQMASWEWWVERDELYVSPDMGPLFGFPRGWAPPRLGAAMERVHPDDRLRVETDVAAALRGETRFEFEFATLWADGSTHHLAVLAEVYRTPEGEPRRVVGVTWDRTEARHVEERLRQAQRMEAVGKLGGGIAHEVNNQVGVVLGFAEFVLRKPDLSPSVRDDVEVIRQSAERAAGVTAQLLAFSRRQLLRPQVLDPAVVVHEFAAVLRRVIGESCTLEVSRKGTGTVRVDRGQLEQVLLNLALNASDAMPGGGRLRLEIADVELDARYAEGKGGAWVRPGPYVAIIMSDTGHGMDARTLGHALEPFFTTKGVGKGTGLGLSSVYGIVKQSDGYLWLYSEPGLGTTVKIYLPRTAAGLEAAAGPVATERPPATGTILLAEDDAMLRAMIARALQEEGYTVLEAADGAEALAVAQRHEGPLALLVTDMVMPGLSGRELAQQVSLLRPGLPVLSMSGYTDDEIVRRGLLEEGRDFLPKPFSTESLLEMVRTMVDPPEADPGLPG
jgi:PAS domain S-box-containing protein